MKYGQKAIIRFWVESHGRLRTTYGYEIFHEDGTLARDCNIRTCRRQKRKLPARFSSENCTGIGREKCRNSVE